MTAVADRSVRDYVHAHIETVSESASALDTARRLRDRRIGSVLVEPADQARAGVPFTGIITETDLVAKVLGAGLAAGNTTAKQIMSAPVLTIAGSKPMLDAVQVMHDKHVRHLGVTDGEEIVGILSIRDVARYCADTASGPVKALNDVYSPLTVLMSRAIETLDSQKTVAEAARWMASQRIGSVFVVEAGELVGIVTETDLVRKTLADGADPGTIQLRSLLHFPLVGVESTRSIQDACDIMATHHIRHLAVTERTKIVGVISIRDLIKMVAARDRPEYLRRQ
ncbi:MAG: CBS domain-containing protein [Nitrospiraceae bacterium]